MSARRKLFVVDVARMFAGWFPGCGSSLVHYCLIDILDQLLLSMAAGLIFTGIVSRGCCAKLMQPCLIKPPALESGLSWDNLVPSVEKCHDDGVSVCVCVSGWFLYVARFLISLDYAEESGEEWFLQ